MNRVISEKALQGQNGLIREKYITISLHEDDYRKAQVRLLKRAEDIQNLFKRMGSTVRRLSGIERLNLLHGITRPEEVMAFSYDWLLAEDSLTTKDFIAPSGYNWKPEHDDSRAVYNDRYQFGEYYGKVLYLRDIAPQMKDNLLSLLSDLDFDNAISIHVDAVEQREAVEQVQKQLAYMQKEKGDGMVNAVRMNLPAYMGVRYELTNQIEDAEELLDNLHNYNQKIFKVCILIHTYGRNNAELDERVQQICNTVQQQTCRFSPIPFEQCAAMNSVLPLGKKWLALERTLLTVNTAIYVPFTTQELFDNGKESLYYGLNALSNNLIMVDRKKLKNPNGLILGTPGSGKSFSAKREICNAFLVTDDDILVCDPESEYAPLVERLHGQVIHISPSSTQYINPMDINANYSEEDNPLALKADFILSLCELVVGGKEGLKPVEKTVIDRCVHKIYAPYFEHPCPETVPMLEDLYNALLTQDEPEAHHVAAALEIYVKGSLNIFNHRTNVDIDNRIVCYDIKQLGKQLKKLGMLIVQDQVWGRVTANRSVGKSTRYYADEFHLLLKDEQTAAYSVEIWKRFRKWGGIPTALTQNVKDLLASPEVSNIFENSDFVYMLNQANGDRQILAKQLNISPHQLSYVTHSGEGEGLLFFGNVILPFVDHFPKDLELYRILTTRLSEVAEAQKHE